MTPLRRILIILVFLVALVILVWLLVQRVAIMKLPETVVDAATGGTGGVREGLVSGSPNSVKAGQTNELTLMTVKNPGPGVTNYNVTAVGNLPLSQYCIKASYNSACSGSYMNLDALSYVLSRGCRFLDFELYYMNQTVVVGYSDDGHTLLTKNTVPFLDVLNRIATAGFSAPSPNLGDPLFVQLRIRTTEPAAYQEIASAITSVLSAKLYQGKVDSNTLIGRLLGKVVLVVDAQVSGDYALYPNCAGGGADGSCKNLGALVNIQSNIYPLYKYTSKGMMAMLSNPPAMIDTQTSDVTVLRMVEPASSTETTNPNVSHLLQNYGVQVVENRFYMTDTYLTQYEQVFRDNHSAFVPFYVMIPYFTKKGGN
jgi:hypothetical protein